MQHKILSFLAAEAGTVEFKLMVRYPETSMAMTTNLKLRDKRVISLVMICWSTKPIVCGVCVSNE